MGSEHLRTSLGQQRFLEYPRQCPSGSRRISRREPQQREPGLWVVTELAGSPVRPRRLVDLATEPLEFGQLVQGCTERRLPGRIGEHGARPERLDGRLVPTTVELEDLRAVYEAASAERNEVRLRVAPRRQGPRPLARPSKVTDLVARLDDPAVDDAGNEGGDLFGDHCHHGAVERVEPLGDPPEVDLALTPTEATEAAQVGVAAGRADGERPVEVVERGCRVARPERAP